MSRARRTLVPTICPHCLVDQNTADALSGHVRFACPVLRPLLCWSVVYTSEPDAKGWRTWRGVNGSKVVNVTMLDGLTPTDRDFDDAMAHAVALMRAKLGR